ncbi:hypothetical protein BY458DRAFT_477286 [Sporodiniella umbellata]|nr:hypothetical protein BY458DRAFT_477286 [Sporodiniella umbellata]
MSTSVVKHAIESGDIQPRQKRFKVGRACFTCREKKIKCDGVQPCMQCKARKRPCSFSIDGSIDAEAAAASKMTHPEDLPKEPTKKSKQKNNQNLEKQKTADMLDKLSSMLPGEGKEGKWEVDERKLKIKPTTDLVTPSVELPSKPTQEQWITLYFKYGYSTFPILPRKLFLKQFESKDGGELTQPLLLYIIFALGAQYQAKPNLHLADGYFRHAKNLLDHALDHPRLSTVIALALMSLYDGNNEKTKSSIYSAMAFQMCFDLGLTKNYSGDFDDNNEWNVEILELRKRVCWGCYYLDKLVHIQSGQPWVIRQKDIQLDLPLLQPGDNVTEHEILEVFVSSIKLLQMGERLLQPEQQNMMIDHPMSPCHSDNELIHWLRSLPPHLQWTTTACVIPPIPPPNPPRNAMVCQLHLLYNLIELILLKPYTNSSNKLVQQRSITVSTNIIRLVSLSTEKTNWVLNYTFILNSSMEAIRNQLKYSTSESLSLARHARYMFQQSMQLLQILLVSRNSLYSTIHEFTTRLGHLLSESPAVSTGEEVIYDMLDPFVLQQEEIQRTNAWPIHVKTKSYITPNVSAPTHTIYNNQYHDHLFHTSWRAAMTIDRGIHYPKIPLDFLEGVPTAHPGEHKPPKPDYPELSGEQIEALVAQIQETSKSESSSRQSTSHATTPNNDDLLFSLLSEPRTKESLSLPQPRHSFSHPYTNVGLGIYASAHQHHSDNTAIIVPRSAPIPARLTFGELLKVIQEFSQQLSALVPASYLAPGRSISISYPNTLEFVISFLGTTLMNLVASPLNPAYTEDEFNFYLQDAQSSILILPPGSLQDPKNPAVLAAKKQGVFVVEVHFTGTRLRIDAIVPPEFKQQAHRTIQGFVPQPDQPALLLHTSGTTGRPKGVPLTHLNLVTTMRNIIQTYELVPEDRTLLVMPLFHVHGLLCGLLATLLSGGTAVIPTKFSASHFWQDFKQEGCNWYTAVPTIHQILLRHPPEQVPKIRFIRSCSSSLAPSTLEALEHHFKAPVLEAYAMTEASHQMTSNPLPHRGPHKAGSVGLGQGVEIAILDEQGKPVEMGEVCIRGKNVTHGYLNNPEATAGAFTADGFFRTGDQGKKDQDGYLILTGRIKELINRGGEKISPIELDGTLLSHPHIAEAVSFGVPDEMYGQEVHAAVVLKPGVDATGMERDIQSFCLSKMAKFKVPKRIYLTDIMPKTATGKIQRRKMVDVFFKGPVKSQARL